MAEEARQKKWKWLSFFYVLAKGDITRIPEITKMNYIFTMNLKAFEYENKKIKEYYG